MPTSNGERLALAELCTNQKRYRASAGLYADAFGADPRLANDLNSGHRYNPACHAFLAVAEQEEDAAKPDRPKPCVRRCRHTDARSRA
jgi:hypothetical protein